MPAHDEGTPGDGVRQEPPVPAQGGGGGDSEASGGTVLMVPPDAFLFIRKCNKTAENISFLTREDKGELHKTGP